MNAPRVVVEAFSFCYPGRSRSALSNVSFQVAEGEVLLVLGPSGGGKSTLAHALMGLIPHLIAGEASGRILIDDLDTRETPVAELARHVGLVFQDPDSQFCMLRVDDEVAFGLENLRVSPSEMPGRVTRALERVGLSGAERRRIDQLSGGEKQRLALASVLAMLPPIVIFDEPTSALDPRGAAEVLGLLSRLKDEGRSIIVVEHRLDHLAPLVDRVLALGPTGAVVADGPARDIFSRRADELSALGIWVPPTVELAVGLKARGITLYPDPLSISEAEEAIERVEDRLLLATRAAESGTVPFRTAPPELDLMPDQARRAESGRGGRPCPPWGGTGQTQDPASSPPVQIERLTSAYARGKVVLHDVSLRVEAGRFFALVGPNGAGKSTLAKHLIGALKSKPGQVRVFGRDVCRTRSTELTGLVGYVFQNPEHQFVGNSVFDDIAFGPRQRGLPEAEVAERVSQLLDELGLAELARVNPYRLSFGEKRRLSVAAMAALGQPLLILDEPTFGQDRRGTEALLATLVNLRRAGRTVIVITHDVELVAEYTDEVAVLVDGGIAFQGPPDALFQDASLLDRARLVVPPAVELSRRLRRRDPTFPVTSTTRELVEAIGARCAGAGRASVELAVGS